MKPYDLLMELQKIKGGDTYSGAASYQVCFPLKAGGELRFSINDEDEEWFHNPDGTPSSNGYPIRIDLYDGKLPPCITGPSHSTGITIPEPDSLGG